MKTWIAAFVISFIGYFLATIEIGYIAKDKRKMAVLTAAIAGVARFATVTIIVISPDRWQLMIPFVLGDIAATWAGMKWLKK